MARQSIAEKGVGERDCVTCAGRGWTFYQVETPEGEQEEALELCDCSRLDSGFGAAPETSETALPKKMTPGMRRLLNGIAHHALHGHEIERVGGSVYRVPSTTGGGKYRVELSLDGDSCRCVDFHRTGFGFCRHTIAASLIERELEEEPRDSLLTEYEKRLYRPVTAGEHPADSYRLACEISAYRGGTEELEASAWSRHRLVLEVFERREAS